MRGPLEIGKRTISKFKSAKMRGTVVKRLKKKAREEKKDYKKLNKAYKSKAAIPLMPKNTVRIRWMSGEYSSFARMFTEVQARELVSRRKGKNNISSAVWFDRNRVATDLLKPTGFVPAIT
jgi:hypothetical protein